MQYAVVDIETTGGNAKREKITEIAVYQFDGQKITDEFNSLVNPERHISQQIQQLTGITNEMVAEAPKFYEIAKRVVEITRDCIFVAHNAAFDYHFIQQEFKSLGYDFQRNYLCSVKLSRKLIPGLSSYSLGKLSAHLGIEIESRHRASGDAMATVKLLRYLLNYSHNPDLTDVALSEVLTGLNENLEKSVIKELPEKTGVYYFQDTNGSIIYIGKSLNIRKRIHSHFSNTKSVRSIEMKSQTAYIDYKITGSELVALLHEAYEVKKHKPHYNRLLRRRIFTWGLYAHQDLNGYINLSLKRNNRNNGTALVLFNNKKEGENFLYKQIEQYLLCQKLCGVYKSNNACFHHQIGLCKGACVGEEPAESYNQRVEELIAAIAIPSDSYFIVDKGRHQQENAIVKIENGIYKGYGFIDTTYTTQISHLHDAIQARDDEKDARAILRSFIGRKRYEKLIHY